MNNKTLSDFSINLLFIIGAILFVFLLMTVAKLIRPDRPNAQKLTSYECGEDAIGSSWSRFNMRFYIVGLIFLLFEVEIIFLFPWAVIFGDKPLMAATNQKWGWFLLVEMFIFIFILLLGLAYVWAKGYLNWVRPKQELVNFKSGIPRQLYEDINNKYASSTIEKRI